MNLFNPNTRLTKAERKWLTDQTSNHHRIRRFVKAGHTIADYQKALTLESQRDYPRAEIIETLLVKVCRILRDEAWKRIYKPV